MSYTSNNPRFSTTILTDQGAAASTAAPSGSHRIIDRSGTLWLVDSSGNETPVGSATSGINYLSSFQDATKDLGTVQTSVGDVLASSTRSNPGQWGCSAVSSIVAKSTDSSLRGTSNYLISYGANAQFVESALFAIDGSDVGKPLVVSFDLTGVTTADDVQVYIARYNSSNVLQERILVAGTASATTPNSAQLPTGKTSFRGFFITSGTATDLYAVRWLRNANNTSLRIDTLSVGPQSLASGAVVTDPITYTPTSQGFGTLGSSNLQWRRVGSEMHITGRFVTGTLTAVEARIGIPSGLTIDNFAGQSGIQAVGVWSQSNGAANSFKSGHVLATPGTNYLTFSSGDYTPGINPLTSQTATTLFFGSNITEFVGEIVIPISQWQSNVTMADRAVEEYAYNTDTSATASVTASGFASGVDGIAFSSNFVVGTTWIRRVRFPTNIQPTDRILIEINDGSGWMPEEHRLYGVSRQNTTDYGMQLRTVSGSSTDMDLYLLPGGLRGDGASYGANGTGFSTLTAFKWRVRKVSGGASVGFPIAPANITLVNSAENYTGNTRLGLMGYAHGTTYNGGNAPTITLVGGGGTLTSVGYSQFVPYQLADGSWRMKFNIAVLLSTTTRVSCTLGIAGVTGLTASGNGQGVTGAPVSSATVQYCVFKATGNLELGHLSVSSNEYVFSGDVALASKPTWAY